MEVSEIKKKKCSQCPNEFTPFLTTDTVCSFVCAKNKKQNKANKIVKVKAVEPKRKELLKNAEFWFNKFIRERDKNEKCFCCDLPLGQDFQAGHVFSGGGHVSVKFEEDNVHGQRFECNNGHRASLLSDMMVGCEKRIGEDAFIVLREKAYEVKKWERSELKVIIEIYKKKYNELRELQ
jgi:hypothetical protein